MNEMKKREERDLIKKAMEENGLRLTIYQKSCFRNGALIEKILYKGWNDEGEEVASGSCLAKVLESIEKWRERESTVKKPTSATAQS
ncbi:MAG: hypothetical protein GX843_05110 [Synergistaceae bacterium]|jgi:hypothetical protein|nr:hypothetical protein [Synergistaceae bacterium]